MEQNKKKEEKKKMGKKYEEKKPTGREYLDTTVEFCDHTYLRCERLPKRWESLYVTPLLRAADEIEHLVVKANRIYINEKMDKTKKTEAYIFRVKLLQEALMEHSNFSRKFSRMMRNVDTAGAERERLAKTIKNIIMEEKETDPGLKEIDITAHQKLSEISFQSMNGLESFRLRLTQKDVDRWLDLKATSESWIKERIRKDNSLINKMQAI